MTNTTEKVMVELNQDKARAEVLRREIAGCRGAMPYLKPCMRPMNQKRITIREAELATLEALIALTERVRPEEIARCEEAAANDYSVKLGEFTLMHSEWTMIFNRVAPKENWKTAIRARVHASDTECRQILEAITFFTGSVGTAVYNGNGTFTFTAAGYYAACGA